MSYEVVNEKKVPCPCGEGRIKYVLEENDWFQTKERIYIDCINCAEKYTIVSEYFCTKPKHDFTVYHLKNKKTGEKKKLYF